MWRRERPRCLAMVTTAPCQRTAAVGAGAHAAVSAVNPVVPVSRTGRRPTVSLSGPRISWPTMIPTRRPVNDICAPEASMLSETAVR